MMAPVKFMYKVYLGKKLALWQYLKFLKPKKTNLTKTYLT